MICARVVGAGITGLTLAAELARRGVQVEVVERTKSLGAGACSWLAGGMLAPWCERENSEPLVGELGREALAYWREHFPGTVVTGTVVLAQPRDVPELAMFARRTEAHRWIGADELKTLEPDLGERFSRALYFADEAHLDPRAAMRHLAGRLRAMGVKLRLDIDACNETSHADIIFDARGLAARDTLRDLRGVKGEMLLVHADDIAFRRTIRLLHPRFAVYVVPRGHGFYMIGATQIESDDGERITARALVELLTAAYVLNPAFAQAHVVETGAGVRPAFPDNLPRIRKRGRTVYVNGLFRHGFLLAPALARMAVDAGLDGAFFPEVMDEDHRQRQSA